MVGASITSPITSEQSDGLRPVNLRTDLAPLADLIELSFQDMDDNGRAAIREMRYMSRMGASLNLFGRLNTMTLGISLGFVWIQDNRLVGNVSIYPANWHRGLGEAYIIANVATHPDYMRRGIAYQLMTASLENIGRKGADHAILQVDYHNHGAIGLYEKLGFVKERAFTTWWRSALAAPPPKPDPDAPFIARPRRSDWRAEYQLATQLRPNEQGGMGWLKPLHKNLFGTSFWQRLANIFAITGNERLIIRADNQRDILASLWIDSGFAMTRTRLSLLLAAHAHPRNAEALLNTVLRRFRTASFVLEHPADDTVAEEVLRRYRFFPHRTVWHMRYDF